VPDPHTIFSPYLQRFGGYGGVSVDGRPSEEKQGFGKELKIFSIQNVSVVLVT
jgi:hypothetical protein